MSASLQLPSNIYSREQLLQLDDKLNLLEDELRDQSARLTTGLHKKEFSTDNVPELVEIFGLSEINQDNIRLARQQLADTMAKAKIIHLVFAHQPSLPAIEELVSWFRQQFGGGLLFQITTNPSIIGGVVIRLGSKLYDFSFASALANQKATINKVISSV